MSTKDVPCKHIFNQLRPIKDVEHIMDFHRQVEAGHVPDPNRGIMSVEEYEMALDANRKPTAQGRPSIPILYQPIIVQVGVKLKCQFIYTGQQGSNNPPAGWPAREHYHNRCKMAIGRICHTPDARKLVTDPDNNILRLDGRDYVVGNAETPAVFLINASKSGTNGLALLEAKKLSLAHVPHLKNLVGRFNNALEVVLLDDGTFPGPELVIAPNMVIRNWGYLQRGTKILTPEQIREAIASEKTGDIKFHTLESPIVGEGISEKQLLAVMRKSSSKDSLDSAWYNLGNTLCRTNPAERTPFGFYSLQCKLVPCKFYSKDGKEELLRFVIDAFVGDAFKENVWDVKQRLAVAAPPRKKAPPKERGQKKAKPVKKMSPKRQKKKASAPKTTEKPDLKLTTGEELTHEPVSDANVVHIEDVESQVNEMSEVPELEELVTPTDEGDDREMRFHEDIHDLSEIVDPE